MPCINQNARMLSSLEFESSRNKSIQKDIFFQPLFSKLLLTLNDLDHYVTPYLKLNSKSMKDLKIRPEIVKLPEEHKRYMLLDIAPNQWKKG